MMEVYRNLRNGFAYVQDAVGVYTFQFDKATTNRQVKGKLREWGITTRKKVDAKRFNPVSGINFDDGSFLKI